MDPYKMKHYQYSIKDFSQKERKILLNQFQQSPFYKQQQNSPADKRRQPIAVDIFDFDSTLFLSPQPSPNIWDTTLLTALTTENLIGPGWWRDLRSLQVIPEATTDDQQQSSGKRKYPDYSRFWNEDVVQEVERSFANPNRMTVLLTGRRHHPFYELIHQILASRGLDRFDIMGLRPDPEKSKPHNNPIIDDGLRYNYEPDVFNSTMKFKMAFIMNLLNAVPSLREIKMWDDRLYHVQEFRTYLHACVIQEIIDKGTVEYVVPMRPKYNAMWEIETIKKILKSHNSAVKECRRRALNNGQQIHSRNEHTQQQPNKKRRKTALNDYEKAFEGPVVYHSCASQVIKSYNLVNLRPVERYITLQLSSDTRNYLKEQFEEYYQSNLKTDEAVKDWERKHAEEPVFFGQEIFLTPCSTKSRVSLQKRYPELFEDDKPVSFKVTGMSTVSYEQGFFLRVLLLVDNNSATYKFPLWCKPSKYIDQMNRKINWLTKNESRVEQKFKLNQDLLHGKLSTHKLYTLNNLDEYGYGDEAK